MKHIAFGTLIIILVASLFPIAGVEVGNNTVAVAVMMLLLVLFSDLSEFNFWGLWGKTKHDELQELTGTDVIEDTNIKRPSRYKLTKAQKDDTPQDMGTAVNNFLATSYEIERLLRVVARAFNSVETSATLTPELVIDLLRDEQFLTESAHKAISTLREVRNRLIYGKITTVSAETLDVASLLANEIYAQLKEWVDMPKRKK